MRPVSLTAAFALLLLPAWGAAQSRDAVEPALLARLRSYAARYIATMTSVVAHERYVQSLTVPRMPRSTVLLSDVLMLRLPESKTPVWFRDVYDVDGRPVRDRQDRLRRLLGSTAGGSLDDLRRIAVESARFNLGRLPRTTNVPDLAFSFLEAPDGRLKLDAARNATIDGEPARVLRFEEVGSPTVVRSVSGRDVPARGRLWVAPETGELLRSELILGDAVSTSTTTVDFAVNPRLPVRVPARMAEHYRMRGEVFDGLATYTDVRVFEVTTSEGIKKPPPGVRFHR